jgi:alpha-mannosidase
MLNQGLAVLPGCGARAGALPVACEGDGVELAVLKRAEDGAGLVVRLVETRGMRARARLACADAGARIVPVSLAEWDEQAAAGTGSAELTFTPFEIKTLRIRA